VKNRKTDNFVIKILVTF